MISIFLMFAFLLGLKLFFEHLTTGTRKSRRASSNRRNTGSIGSRWKSNAPSQTVSRRAKAFAQTVKHQTFATKTSPPAPYARNIVPMISEIEVTCPHCQCVLSAPLDMAGHNAICESCRTIVQVPTIGPSPIPAAKEFSDHPSSVPVLTLDLLRELEWRRFEDVTAAYFERSGWTAQLTNIGADGGIDVKLFRPNIPKVAAVVQCKSWFSWKVRVQPIRELFGVMAAESVSNGFFVTSGDFTEEARTFAKGKPLTLIDGNELVLRIMLLPSESRRQIFKIATFGDYKTPSCSRCGRKMVRRISAKGRGDGKPFWGCSDYPRCKATLKTRSDDGEN